MHFIVGLAEEDLFVTQVCDDELRRHLHNTCENWLFLGRLIGSSGALEHVEFLALGYLKFTDRTRGIDGNKLRFDFGSS